MHYRINTNCLHKLQCLGLNEGIKLNLAKVRQIKKLGGLQKSSTTPKGGKWEHFISQRRRCQSQYVEEEGGSLNAPYTIEASQLKLPKESSESGPLRFRALKK